jgi:hypothetical protein
MNVPVGAKLTMLIAAAAIGAVVGLLTLRAAARPDQPGPPDPERVRGTVVDGAGRGVAGVRVGVLQGVVDELSLLLPTIENCYSTTTDANGAFEVWAPGLGGIDPGPHSGWSIWARDDARGLIGAVTFGAPPGRLLEVRLAPAAYIHTAALDAGGKPIPGLATLVTLTEVGFTSPGPPTDEQGEVRIGPLPADFPLRIDFAAVLDYLILNGAWQSEERPAITLTAGETRELPPLRIGVAQRTLRGTVLGEDGRPVAGARVRTIIPSAFPVKTVTDANGAFALTGLLPTRDDLWVLASHPIESLHVARRTDPTIRDCELTLRPLTTARGQLADAQGHPPPGVHVHVSTFVRVGAGDAEDWWFLDDLARPEDTGSDADGFWEIDGLVSGAPYRAFLSRTAIAFDKGPLAFVANADEPVDVGLVMPRN